MKCPNCQTDNPEKRKICRECGTKLLTVCSQCGFINPPEDKFCAECGQSMAEQTAGISNTPTPSKQAPSPILPTSFVNSRYTVKKFFGEDGKK